MTTKKTNPGGGSTSTPDRISELPKEILVHILGFLDMDKFLIGTSLVSTKWRNLWKSVSFLKFPMNIIDIDDDGSVVDDGLVDHVLGLRDSEASKIQILKYDWACRSLSSSYNYLERLHNIIVSAAVDQGAQEIQIGGIYLGEIGNMVHFNPSIFTSGLLRKFTLRIFIRTCLIQFPRSMCSCATQLTYLSLCGIRLPEGDDAAQLHLVCPLLETLVISNCYSKHLKVLDISVPKLITLSIDNSGISRGDLEVLGGCRIEIRTPNLTSLDYSGHVYVDCFTENLPYITDASLHFTEESGMVKKTSFATKLLKGLTSAKSLSLAGFEDFSQDTLKVLLTPFTSLRTLELESSCKISSIHGMVHFLNSCGSIEKLVWKVDEFDEVEGDEDLMLPQCRLSHLKHVHIQSLCGHENEIEFVKFLLKSSVVLEDLIIKTTKNSPKQTIEENLMQFIEEEPSFRSFKLRVSFE